MAVPSLKAYAAVLTTANTAIGTAPGTGRALVISKIIVTASQATTISITVNGFPIAVQVPLTAGQVYSETGIVLTAGATLQALSSVANACNLSYFGEEVDN